jgi:hypothetical protein
MGTHLFETDLGGSFTETLSADVHAVLSTRETVIKKLSELRVQAIGRTEESDSNSSVGYTNHPRLNMYLPDDTGLVSADSTSKRNPQKINQSFHPPAFSFPDFQHTIVASPCRSFGGGRTRRWSEPCNTKQNTVSRPSRGHSPMPPERNIHFEVLKEIKET